MMLTMANSKLIPFDFAYCSDKAKVFENYCKYTFTRTQSMFTYEGLPDTIPVQWLESYLQRNGSCCIAEHEGKLYALLGNAGGEPDEYYQPTIYTVANPALNLSKNYKIGEDCVYCKNDYDAIGLVPLVSRYCGLMTENLLTVRISDINMRMMNLLSAPDDNTLQSTKQYLKDLEDGKLGVVGETPFFEGLKLQSKGVGNGDYMIQFIELQQYLKGSMYNELGINANFNMKREALSGQELSLNDDALMPLIDDMLKQRRAMCDELNQMFGLNVSVDYGSSWHSNVVEKQLISEEELGADDSESEEAAGDESALPDDKDPNAVDEGDVSRLNDDEESGNDDNDNTSSDSNVDEPDENCEDDDSGSESDDECGSDDNTSDEDTSKEDESQSKESETDKSKTEESDAEKSEKEPEKEEVDAKEEPEKEEPEKEKPEKEKPEKEEPEKGEPEKEKPEKEEPEKEKPEKEKPEKEEPEKEKPEKEEPEKEEPEKEEPEKREPEKEEPEKEEPEKEEPEKEEVDAEDKPKDKESEQKNKEQEPSSEVSDDSEDDEKKKKGEKK